MKNNPYLNILKLMESQGEKNNPPSLQLGQVINISPLKIKIGDLILEKYNLLINENLLKHDKEITINNTSIIKEKSTIETTLNINDTVAALSTQDRQTYIVLAKVV